MTDAEKEFNQILDLQIIVALIHLKCASSGQIGEYLVKHGVKLVRPDNQVHNVLRRLAKHNYVRRTDDGPVYLYELNQNGLDHFRQKVKTLLNLIANQDNKKEY